MFQEPRAAIEPTILMVWPKVVVVLDSNFTATVGKGVAHPVDEAVDVALVEVEEDWDEVGVDPDPPLILISAQVR